MLVMDQTWTFPSSGAGTAVNAFGYGSQNTVYYECAAGGTTGVVKIQTARTSAGPWADVPGTSTNTTTNATNVISFSGPLMWVRPFCASTGVTVELVVTGDPA